MKRPERGDADAMNDAARTRSWSTSLAAFLHPRAIAMLFLGLSAGLPILLIFSSLGLWLREAGLSRSAVTMFSWAALGYSFKFVWAPLIDRLPVPVLTRLLGRRRAWILVSQGAVIAAICWMALTDPAAGGANLTLMAMAAVLLGFSSATQDIVIDAYRIESADDDLQAMLSATYIAGYRIGMLVAGAGALWLAESFGSNAEVYDYAAWREAYLWMAAAMLIGVATTLVVPEPERGRPDRYDHDTGHYLRFLGLFLLAVAGFIATFVFSAPVVAEAKAWLTEATGNGALAGFVVAVVRLAVAIAVAGTLALVGVRGGLADRDMVTEAYVDPVRDFFHRYGLGLAWLLLALIGLYRISDIVLGVIANVFYQDIGFTKSEIAGVVKTYGLFMTIAGGFVGGILAVRYGVIRILFLGALLTVVTNLLFILLNEVGRDMTLLYIVISADNLTAGLASAAFVAFLSSLTNVQFTAVQYAIFSSLMTLIPKIVGGYSGTMVDAMGYSRFFLVAALLGMPVLILVWAAAWRLKLAEANAAGAAAAPAE